MTPEELDKAEKLAFEPIPFTPEAIWERGSEMQVAFRNMAQALRKAWSVIGLQEHEILFRCAEVQAAIAERDEARAEVERLKESVTNLDALYVSRTDALRESEAEVERLRKLLNPKPKPDLGETLMRLIREDQRKAIYSQAWQEAILEGNTREQAHCIAADAVKAALKEEG